VPTEDIMVGMPNVTAFNSTTYSGYLNVTATK